MPTRIIREGILTSKRVNRLTPLAELFYRRLMSVVDDFGRYFSDTTLLRAACYPLQVDRVNDASISNHLAECEDARLIVRYTVDGTGYLAMLDTRQQVRAKKSKYPEPPKHLLDKCLSFASPTDKRMIIKRLTNVLEDEDGVEDESTAMSGKPDAAQLPLIKANGAEAREILAFLNEKAGRRYQANRVNIGFIVGRLRDGATAAECKQVIAKKCRQWKGNPKMDEYLRPATLFGAEKFAQYQGELVVSRDTTKDEP